MGPDEELPLTGAALRKLVTEAERYGPVQLSFDSDDWTADCARVERHLVDAETEIEHQQRIEDWIRTPTVQRHTHLDRRRLMIEKLEREEQ